MPSAASAASASNTTNTAAPGRSGMMDGGMMACDPGGGSMMGGSQGSQGTQPNSNARRLSGDQVRQAVTSYLNTYYSGQGVVIDEIMEFQSNFYVQIKEQSTGVNAFELLVDPNIGSVFPEYGPNMMWNTKYGPMSDGHMGNNGMMGGAMMGHGMMGGNTVANQPTANMPVTAQQGVQYARQYLAAQGSGLTTEDQVDTFYGYYTIDTLKDGKIQGMLSVNGYTGQVWLHTWHGTFIGMVN
jgi:hypothetical protein